MHGKRTKSGVFVFDNFRDNLIIDRYDTMFATMRGSKIDHLRSENSEDALTWNVFRSLRQINPALWFPRLFARAFGVEIGFLPSSVCMHFWPSVSPPPALRLFQKDEGDSEIDISLETGYLVWFIEAKYRRDVSARTTNNPDRDQILRMIDIGSWYAGVRDFYFSLLVLDEKRSSVGISLINRYLDSKDEMLVRLPHRRDGLQNLRGLGMLKWADVAEILSDCSRLAARDDEKLFATRAVEWLEAKEIGMASQEPKASKTHGYRSQKFEWKYDSGAGELLIESARGIKHQFGLQEIQRILERLAEEFEDRFFPLGNNVEKLHNGTEVLGLGIIILEQRQGNVSHAQGASYLGVVLEECGYLKWNQKRRGIQWCLLQKDFGQEALVAKLQGK